MFIPDSGYTIIDIDQAGADAQVVAWESEDEALKAKFRSGKKVHALNAIDIFGTPAGPDGKREPYYTRAKVGVHATNYGAGARTVAMALGITTHEAERFQARWFAIHPGIPKWHARVRAELEATHSIRNPFGYRRLYFDRTDNVIKEALAWVPQSTVACVTNRAWSAIDSSSLPTEVLLQVHDSLVLQIPSRILDETLRSIRPLIAIPIPYPDPLIIPWGLKTSHKSWGECNGRQWP
jgi:DNA polymerase-1